MRKLSLVVMGAVVGAGTATLVSQTQLLSGTSAIAASPGPRTTVGAPAYAVRRLAASVM